MTGPSQTTTVSGISRRRFLTDAGVAAAAAAELLAVPSVASARRLRGRPRPSVAVLGGGVAGLTAAHELAERGFSVTVYERRAWGGKARSMPVPGTASGGRRDLPAEHGWREVFGAYRNLPDTLARIPAGASGGTVTDNLRPTPILMLARTRGQSPITLVNPRDPSTYTPADAVDTLLGSFEWLPPSDVEVFARRFVVFLSSGDARRMGEWEGTSWSDFIHGDEMTPGSRKLYVDVATRFAAASRGEVTSARTIGKATESTIYLELTGRGESRLFNGPTSEAWIDPWTAHLARLGVRLRLGHDVTRLEVHDGRIAAARVRGPNGSRTIHADWYVLALPVERARALFNRRVMAADTRLLRTANIETGWMTGIQFYLNHPTPIVHGIIACLDSPWAVCGLTQGQFWDRNLPCDYGNGRVRDKLSLAIVDWETPGILYGKPARKCTRAEIAAETWAQLKAHFTYAGAPPLPDSLLVTGDPATSSFLDPGIVFDGHTPRTNQDPLPLNIVGSWEDRPTVDTAIPNLLLASDYVQVDFDIASMEGANEAARRAVNALLDRAGSTQPRAQVYPRLMPGEWQALRQLDDKRYAAGLPNIFDADMAIDQLKTLLAQPLDALARAETGILAATRP